MLEVIDLMACLRSSVGISYLPTIGIILSMVFRPIHATIGIRAYQFHLQQMVLKLTVFVQDSSALDKEYVKSIEYGGGIKMKKTTRKVQICSKVKIETCGVY